MNRIDTVKAEALAARAAGDLPRAMRAWREVLLAAPADWPVALELQRDMAAAWHNPDSDPLFRVAARALPDEEWLAHYAACPVLPAAELDWLGRRASALVQARPDDGRAHAVAGQVARQRRNWPGAVAAFTAAAMREPRWAPLLAEAHRYARLAGRAWPETGERCALFVINLDRNPERMTAMRRQCEEFAVQPERLAGVEGLLLPQVAAAMLAGTAVAHSGGPAVAPVGLGTLGCYMSHVMAWERLLAGPMDAALVLEDDALPLLPLPGRLGGLGLPPGWDVVWVNDRVEPRGLAEADGGFRVRPLATALGDFAPDHNAIGADGYLISRAGAAKLLEWVARDGMAGDVDWRMAAYAVPPGGWSALRRDGEARRLLEALAPSRGGAEQLAGYALSPALVREVSLQSDRQDADRMAAACATVPHGPAPALLTLGAE